MKSLFHLITLLAISSLFLISCSKEGRIAKRVDGHWTITSYVITQDSTLEELELLGLLFSKGFIEFETYDLPNSSGAFAIGLNDILSDSLVVTNGLYELDEEGEEMILTIQEANNPTSVDVTKEKLEIEGIIDGTMATIKADRT